MTGVRLFVRQSSSAAEGTAKTPFRLTCEGVPLLDSMLSDKRRVRLVSFAELKTLLTEAYPNISQLEPPTVSKLESMGKYRIHYCIRVLCIVSFPQITMLTLFRYRSWLLCFRF